jgi:biopolymer transport protein ExbB/TolQ
VDALVQKSTQDVVKVVDWCRRLGAAIAALLTLLFATLAFTLGEQKEIVAFSPTAPDFWIQKLFFQGVIPYLIVGMFLAGVFYVGLLWRNGGMPIRTLQFEKEAREIQAAARASAGRARSLRPFIDKTAADSPLRFRLEALDALHHTAQSRDAVFNDNDRLTAAAEANLAYMLSRLIFVEWMLPILGFVGTVWGVTAAVYGLSGGIGQVFREGALTLGAVGEFNRAFSGLSLAFDTTLFGLIGLGVVGCLHVQVRRTCTHLVIVMDETCHQAAFALADESLADLIRTGFFEVDQEGRLVADAAGKPVLRWQAWMDDLRSALIETDGDGRTVTRGDKPVLRWQRWMDHMLAGTVEVQDDGEVMYEEGRPVPRWRRAADLLLSDFFYSEQGDVLRESTEAPLRSKSAAFRAYMQNFASLLLLDSYELGGDPNSRVQGILKGEDGEEERRPLQSTRERRFRQIENHLAVLQLLLARQSGAGDPGVENVAPLGQQILEPNGAPCEEVVVVGSSFAISREKDLGFGEYVIHTGRIDPYVEGQYRLGVRVSDIPVNQRPTGIAVHVNCIAFSAAYVIHVLRADPTDDSGEAELDLQQAATVPQSVALLEADGILHAMFAAQEAARARVVRWVANGDGGASKDVVQMKGVATLAFGASDRGVLCAFEDDGQHWLGFFALHRAPQLAELGTRPVAMTIGPRHRVWLAEQDGALAEFEMNGQGLARTGNMLRDNRLPDWIAVTADGQIVTAKRGDGALHVLAADASSEIRYPSAITALAASVAGDSLIVGLADGSAYLRDSRPAGARTVGSGSR